MSYTLTIEKVTDPVAGKLYDWRLDHHGATVAGGMVPWQGKPQKIRALIIRAARSMVPANKSLEIVSEGSPTRYS